MPAKKCATRKPAAKPKRKSACKPAAKPKRRTSACKKKTTTPRSRSVSRSRSASSCRSRSSSCAPCRDPYMMTSSGSCGPVACVDSAGNPLSGYVRNSQGECAPKKCGAGYVFNEANGKCIPQNTYLGQKMMIIKKYNDASRAKEHAQKILDAMDKALDEQQLFTGDDKDKYPQFLGGSGDVAKAQAAYRKALRKQNAERQLNLRTHYENEEKRRADIRKLSCSMSPSASYNSSYSRCNSPCTSRATADNAWANFM